MRIAVLDPGPLRRFVFKQRGLDIEFIKPRDLPSVDLNEYRALIVPSYAYQTILAENQRKLKRYIEDFNMLVLLGATEEHETWLPDFSWDPKGGDKAKIVNENHPILKNISSDDLIVHPDFVAHGSLYPTKNALVVLKDADSDRAVLFIDESKGGVLIATSMDPDYHMVGNNPWPNEVDRATKILHSILDWVNEKCILVDQQHQRVYKVGVIYKIKRNLKLIIRISSAIYFSILAFAALWYDVNFVIGLISLGLAILSFYEIGK